MTGWLAGVRRASASMSMSRLCERAVFLVQISRLYRDLSLRLAAAAVAAARLLAASEFAGTSVTSKLQTTKLPPPPPLPLISLV